MADACSPQKPSVATAEPASLAIASKLGPYRRGTRRSGSARTAGIRSFCSTEAMTVWVTGVTRILRDATILITIPLPANVSLSDDPAARSVVLRRGIPSTHNTPALDRVLMLDGREPDLPTQALHAIERHAQVTVAPPESALLAIAQFELTGQFFSSPTLRKFAAGGRAPNLPEGRTESERRGHLFFVDAPWPVTSRRVLARCAIAVRC